MKKKLPLVKGMSFSKMAIFTLRKDDLPIANNITAAPKRLVFGKTFCQMFQQKKEIHNKLCLSSESAMLTAKIVSGIFCATLL